MNVLSSEAGHFAERLRSGLQAVEGVEKIVLCPPFLSLPSVADRAQQLRYSRRRSEYAL